VLEVCFTLRNSKSDDRYDQKTRLATTAGTWAQDVNPTRACCHEKTTKDSTRLGGFGARAGPTQVGGMQSVNVTSKDIQIADATPGCCAVMLTRRSGHWSRIQTNTISEACLSVSSQGEEANSAHESCRVRACGSVPLVVVRSSHGIPFIAWSKSRAVLHTPAGTFAGGSPDAGRCGTTVAQCGTGFHHNFLRLFVCS
jgi:hypothetical protein